MTWHLVPGRPVRSLVVGERRSGVPPLVVVPGLGALGYVQPLVRACARWTRVHLLDLPGFGHRATARLPADLHALGETTAAWLDVAVDEPVLLLGHSTGAQAVLRAAVARPGAVHAVVAAGATFAPWHRRLGAVVRPVLRTLPHERPGELPAVLPYYARGARGLPVLLRSALADRPEDVARQLSVPLLVVAGRDDALCPPDWRRALAGTSGRVREVPGGHNTPYTHPQETADAVRSVLGQDR